MWAQLVFPMITKRSDVLCLRRDRWEGGRTRWEGGKALRTVTCRPSARFPRQLRDRRQKRGQWDLGVSGMGEVKGG